MRTPLPARRALGLLLVLLAFGVVAACASDRTMLVVRIESNLAVPGAMDSVRVVVTHAGQELKRLDLSLAPGANELPLQVGLLSPSGGAAEVKISVGGFLGSTFVVGQDAVTSFVKGKSLVVEMFLAAECLGVDCHDQTKTCTKDETQGATCVDVNRTPDTLPVFTATLPHPPDAAAGDASALVDGAGGTTNDASAPVDGAGGATGTTDARADAMGGRSEVGVEVPPGCVARTEDCFNGADDDCDGLPDCADPDCAPTTVCVPRPSGDVGTTVTQTQTCPVGFAKVATGTQLGATVQGGGTSCTGCQCVQAATACTAMLTTYPTAADCQAGTNGRPGASVSSAAVNTCALADPDVVTIHGASLSPWTIPASTCVPSGTPVKPTASFANSTRFCMAANVNEAGKTGCAAGSVCMRRPAGSGACVLLDDAGVCPAGTKAGGVLYAGLQDNRTCGACSCDLQGASCDNVVLQLGDGRACNVDTADVHGGARACVASPTGVVTPGYRLAGAPTNGTCKPASALSGTLTPTGGRALCCVP